MPKDPTPRRKARLGSVLAHRQPDLTLVLANIHDPHNVSAIYRSCDAFGVDKVHLYYTDTPFPVLGRKTSASARKWVESVRHRDRQELEASLRAQNTVYILCYLSLWHLMPLFVCYFTDIFIVPPG